MGSEDAPSRDAAPLRTLRWVQQSVLATLAICAVGISVAAESGDLGHTDRRFTVAALALGMTSILARRQALLSRDPGVRLWLAAGSLLLAEAVGLLGTALAFMQGEREAGLLYVLGGALLALRAPAAARIAARDRDGA